MKIVVYDLRVDDIDIKKYIDKSLFSESDFCIISPYLKNRMNDSLEIKRIELVFFKE